MCTKCKNAFYGGWKKLASRMLGSWRLSKSPNSAEICRYAELLENYLKIFCQCKEAPHINIVDDCVSICPNCRFRRMILLFARRMPNSALEMFDLAGLEKMASVYPSVVKIVVENVGKHEVSGKLRGSESNIKVSNSDKNKPDTKSSLPPIIKNQRNLVAQFNEVFCYYYKDSSFNDYIRNPANNPCSKPTSFLLLPSNMSERVSSIDNFSGVYWLTVLYKSLEKEFSRKDTVIWRGFRINKSIELGESFTNSTKVDAWVFLNNWQNYLEVLQKSNQKFNRFERF